MFVNSALAAAVKVTLSTVSNLRSQFQWFGTSANWRLYWCGRCPIVPKVLRELWYEVAYVKDIWHSFISSREIQLDSGMRFWVPLLRLISVNIMSLFSMRMLWGSGSWKHPCSAVTSLSRKPHWASEGRSGSSGSTACSCLEEDQWPRHLLVFWTISTSNVYE